MVRQQRGRDGRELLHCVLPDATVAQVPRWMTDKAVCQAHCTGTAQVTVSALHELRMLIDAVRQKAPGKLSSRE